ncbi:hypothetical protein O181_067630 [Austropuccinia psidii MF-1]|uniref:Uncharacterized protein n=1 Tax=Austropuccinia psidii MF-1 TaxID=1389203 RepID=A0A9Q3EZD2_9BASI|nr:hypothetical protein [Austropuccinia psidii MF-1]
MKEQLEKSDKARIELEEDIQSSINNSSLKNELTRQSTSALDINLLNLNNDLHHTFSRNEEVETSCNFKDIPRLKEWPTFSGGREYNYMEFMKTIDMFKEDFKIPDEHISSRLHSLLLKLEKKWYYEIRQDYGKHSWPWWKEHIFPNWKMIPGYSEWNILLKKPFLIVIGTGPCPSFLIKGQINIP